MDFSFGYSPWLLLLSVVVAGGLTYWTYRSTVPSLPAGWRGVLGGLRFLALALICFLLFKPVIQQIQSSERPPELAVLVDDTESMQVVTAGTESPSAEAARDSVQALLKTLEDDEVPGTARFFGVGEALRALSGSIGDSLRFDGPLRVADRSPVPIHTVTVGDTTRQRDLRLQSVTTNDRAYLDSEVPVRAALTTTEGRGESVTATLEQDGQPLDQREVRLPEGTGEASVDLSFTPETAGLQRLTVRATELSGEVTTRNNSQTVSLRVLESRRQVLLLGAAPSPNLTALRRVYERNADTEVTAHVPTPDGSFLNGPLPDSLSSFDVVVCAGFPSAPVPEEVVERVATVIDDGMPALFFLDRQTDLAAWRDHFASVLPAAPESGTTTFAEAPFTVVDGEQRHPLFRIDDAEVSLFDRLPPLRSTTIRWTPSPDAQVLATGGTQADADPLLVVRRRAGQRTAALLGTGVWRWALLPSELDAADPLWPGLAGNLLRWASTQDDDSPVRVRPVAPTFDGGEPVSFTGQTYDESMQPVSDATVDVTVRDSTGTEYPYTMDPVGQGRYTLDVGTLPEGTYRYEATAQLGNNTLGTDQGQFSVAPLRLEYQDPRADPVLMRQIAARSGGTAYTSQTVNQLPDDLERQSSYSSEVVQQTSEAELWRTSLFLLLILLLLAGEWTLRKYLGLT
ncbi:MAG: hypothetical protein BRD31_05855 [Bacteroidetes bacterium QH_2_64_26]|nr:MAG: hypothetical protein BRD31_05855 [Bacteroidetes bacterium QH_2_64_26]